MDVLLVCSQSDGHDTVTSESLALSSKLDPYLG